MGKAQNINRRAVLVGGIASTAALSVPVAKANQPVATEGNIEAQLMKLAERFGDEAQFIDPSITGMSVGMDAMLPGRRLPLMAIYLTRQHPRLARSGDEQTPGTTGRIATEASEIMRLYREWEAEDQLGNDPTLTEDEAVASCYRLRAIELQMFTLTPKSAAELAAMHIVCTARGVFLADEKFTRLTDQLVAS
jgi:hypothetical protein